MRELDAAHIERCRIRGYLVRVVDEHELGLRVDEAADQPGAGGAVDVAVASRRPSHRDRLLDESGELVERALRELTLRRREVVARADPA